MKCQNECIIDSEYFTRKYKSLYFLSCINNLRKIGSKLKHQDIVRYMMCISFKNISGVIMYTAHGAKITPPPLFFIFRFFIFLCLQQVRFFPKGQERGLVRNRAPNRSQNQMKKKRKIKNKGGGGYLWSKFQTRDCTTFLSSIQNQKVRPQF